MQERLEYIMITIGIECEQLEGKRFGVGHTLATLLEYVSHISDVEKQFKFFLYFKTEIPSDAFLSHPAFEKRILTGGIIPKSFNIFYHILLPVRYWQDGLDLFFFPSYMLPAFFIGKACVVLTNDVYWEAHYGNLPFRYRISYRIFCWWAAKRAKKVITISNFSAKELEKFYDIEPARIIVNPWGIDSLFSAIPKDKEYQKKIKRQYGIADDFFLSVGQAFPRRHIREIINAFAIIAPRYQKLHYIVACRDAYNPPLLETLISQTNKKLGRKGIIYAPYLKREEMPYLMNAAKALIYISDKEAMGLPPLEALACKTPSIVIDNDLSKEMLGNEGFFIKDGNDIQEIAKNMEKILENPYLVNTLIEKQIPRLARFNWHENAKNFLAVAREISQT